MANEEKGFIPEAPPPYTDVYGQPSEKPPGPAPYPSQPLQPGYPPQQAYPQQQGYPQQQAYPQQQGYPQQQAYPPQAAYHQAQSSAVIVTSQPGAVVSNYRAKPDNYLALSLFSTFCCCWIFGIVALIHSVQVDSAWNSGDLEGARRSSEAARRWNKVSIIAGIVVTVILIALVVVSNTRFLYT